MSDTLEAMQEVDKHLVLGNHFHVRFCVAVPSAYRIITHVDKVSARTNSYFLKFPELVFCFNIESSCYRDIANVTLQLFYKKGEKLYSTYLPNQFRDNFICLGESSFYYKNECIKIAVKNYIDCFFANSFIYDFRIGPEMVVGIKKSSPIILSSVSNFFKYWENNKDTHDFEIFNCFAIETNPLDKIPSITSRQNETDLTASYVNSIPYLKNVIKAS